MSGVFLPSEQFLEDFPSSYWVGSPTPPSVFYFVLTGSSTFTAGSAIEAVIAEELPLINGYSRSVLAPLSVTWDGAQGRSELNPMTVNLTAIGGNISNYDRYAIIGDANANGGVVIDGTTNTADAANNQFDVPSHPFAANEPLVFIPRSGTLPTAFTAGTKYYAVSVNAGDFQVSATSGGSAIAFTGGTDGYAIHSAKGVFVGYGEYAAPGTVIDGQNREFGVNINFGNATADLTSA